MNTINLYKKYANAVIQSMLSLSPLYQVSDSKGSQLPLLASLVAAWMKGAVYIIQGDIPYMIYVKLIRVS